MEAKAFGYQKDALKFASDIERTGMKMKEVVSITIDRDQFNCPRYTVYYRDSDKYVQ